MVEIRTDGLVDRERLRMALALLRGAGPAGVTKAQLAKKLGGVCTRTVDRAIQLLEDQGAKLLRERKGRPAVLRFHLEKGPGWDEQVSVRSKALLRGLAVAAAHPGLAAWPQLLDMAEELVGENLMERDRRLLAVLRNQAKEGRKLAVEALENVLKAMEGGRLLELSLGGKSRTVIPCALVPDVLRGGTLLMAAEGPREQVLFVNLANLGSAKVGAKAPELRNALALQAARTYQIGGHHQAQTPFVVRLKVMEAVGVPPLPEFAQKVTKGGVEISFKATDVEGALRWAIAHGAEILEPASLKQALKGHLEKWIKLL